MPRELMGPRSGAVRTLWCGAGYTEEEIVRAALERAHGSPSVAATLVGLTDRTSFWYYLWKHGLEHLPREIRAREKAKFTV